MICLSWAYYQVRSERNIDHSTVFFFIATFFYMNSKNLFFEYVIAERLHKNSIFFAFRSVFPLQKSPFFYCNPLNGD